MKIVKLILQNINSIYGKWEIDFTAPEFAGGLFAITGKTGSGKTTILDAVSLALFAETPRLSHKENREAVSRGASECLAELTFESGGDTYLASFSYGSFKRGGKKGQLTDTFAHKLSKNGTEIATGFHNVTQKVEEIIGLDKERFCRTVMLAQGQFDSFLRAGDKNSEILEQITGTRIYSEIAEVIRDRNSKEKTELERMEAANSGILLLTEEAEADKKENAALLRQQAEKCSAELNSLNEILKCFASLDRLKRELAGNVRKKEIWEQSNADFQADRARLAKAERALPAQTVYENKCRLEQENAHDLGELEAIDMQIPGKESESQTADKNAQNEAKKLTEAEKDLQEKQVVFAEVRTLDHDIRFREDKLNGLIKRRREEETIISSAETQLAETEQKLQSLKNGKKEAETYRAEHEADSSLPERLAAWEEVLKQLKGLKNKQAKTEGSRDSAQKEAETLAAEAGKTHEALEKAEQAFQPVNEAWSAMQKALDDAEAETPKKCLTDQRDKLKHSMDAIWKILSFEEHRKQLEDGKPCPLCGATEHPFAAGQIPEVAQSERDYREAEKRVAERDMLEDELQKRERAKNALESKLMHARLADNAARQKYQRTEDEFCKLEQEIAELKSEYDTKRAAAAEEWRSCGLKAMHQKQILPEAEERIRKFRDAEKKLAEFEKEAAGFESEKQVCLQQKKDAVARIGTLSADEQKESAELKERQEKRQTLFGDKDPDTEENALKKQIGELREGSAKKTEEALLARTELKNLKERQDRLRLEIGNRAVQLEEARKRFSQKCSELAIPEQDYPSFLLPAQEIAELSSKRAALQTRGMEIEATEKRLNDELAAETANLPANRAEEAVQQDFEEKQAEKDDLQKQIGAIDQELVQNEQNKQRSQENLAAILQQKEICAKWAELHGMIGQGNAFQRLAQGITLDNLLSRANTELLGLFSRYKLIRSEKKQLGIDVLDGEQGDVIRPSENLSGGERFVVSLALALGLSNMAGERIRIDSLFLDEGFGTLDSESLQFIMHALGKLHRAGKIVGVISHVSMLAEEIPCVLQVTQTGGGKSILSGPGVKRL